MFIWDPRYFIFALPALLLAFYAQWRVRSTYNKYSRQPNNRGLTGAEVARILLRSAGLDRVRVEETPGQLSDHYDPRSDTVRLSQGIATVPSIAAMAVVAHELGHVEQHQQRSLLIQMRNFLVPAVQITPQIGYMMIIFGLLLNITGLFWLGIIFFGLMVVFMVLTLPVEIDASRRGMRLLNQSGLLVAEQDGSGARSVLTAAAMTYLAAAITAVLQLLYFISLGNNRR